MMNQLGDQPVRRGSRTGTVTEDRHVGLKSSSWRGCWNIPIPLGPVNLLDPVWTLCGPCVDPVWTLSLIEPYFVL